MKSFHYAFQGIVHVIKSEVNMRVHICFAVYIITAGFVCRISAMQWAAVLICVGIVAAAEVFNTAIETLCDELRPEKNANIKIVKDAAAGAVLCGAIASAVVGGVIFFNAEKTSLALEFLKTQPIISGIILLSLIPAALFVFLPRKKHR